MNSKSLLISYIILWDNFEWHWTLNVLYNSRKRINILPAKYFLVIIQRALYINVINIKAFLTGNSLENKETFKWNWFLLFVFIYVLFKYWLHTRIIYTLVYPLYCTNHGKYGHRRDNWSFTRLINSRLKMWSA